MPKNIYWFITHIHKHTKPYAYVINTYLYMHARAHACTLDVYMSFGTKNTNRRHTLNWVFSRQLFPSNIILIDMLWHENTSESDICAWKHVFLFSLVCQLTSIVDLYSHGLFYIFYHAHNANQSECSWDKLILASYLNSKHQHELSTTGCISQNFAR